MEAGSWSRFSSKRLNPPIPPRFDNYLGFEEDVEGGEGEVWTEPPYPPFSEGDDIDYLYDHIDEDHPAEAKAGICPICQAKVSSDISGHLSMEHGSFFKGQGWRRIPKFPSGSHSSRSSGCHLSRSSGYHFSRSSLRKERYEENLPFFHGGQPYGADSSNAAPDPLLAKFICNSPVPGSLKDTQPEPYDEGSISSKIESVKIEERVEPPLSQEDQHERALRSEFARGLVLSTLFDDH